VSDWRAVCGLEQVPVGRGICALVDGQQVAIFRTTAGVLYAVGNRDPFSGAMVLSRGIVGSRRDRPTVASPMFKQVFDLETGVCLDDPEVSITVHSVRLHGGTVEVDRRTAQRLAV